VVTLTKKVSVEFVEQIYKQSQSIKPITLRNIWWIIRHPIFVFQINWFAAKLLGLLEIDHDALNEIYETKRNR
jgi:hypothetical protein